MRNLITDYIIDEVNRTITLPKFANLAESNPFTIANIRLIVNETQQQVICSSMQKNNVSVEGNVIKLEKADLALEDRDQLTIEVDMGDGITYVDSGDWVINAKLDMLKPIGQQKEWVLDDAIGRQLKPIAENAIVSVFYNDALRCLLNGSLCKSADLSSWESLVGTNKAYQMFAYNYRLKDVSFDNIEEISGDSTAYEMFIENATLLQLAFPQLNAITGTRTVMSMFKNCSSLNKVEFSSLRTIDGIYTGEAMFSGCVSLKEITLPNLEKITFTQGGLTSCFSGCVSLKKIEVPNLVTFNSAQGNVGNAMGKAFLNCTGLEEVIAPKLQQVTGYYMFQECFNGCKNLRKIYIPNLIYMAIVGQAFGKAYQGCSSLTEFHINCAILKFTEYNSPVYNATAITDLYLYGTPNNNIYIEYQDKLNFNSVCGVLRKLCENTEANGLVCAFKSGFTMTDQTSHIYTDGDGNTTEYNEPNGILATLKAQAESQGWTIQNLTIK